MTVPRRLRTQAERDADGTAFRNLIGVRTADGRIHAPQDVVLIYPTDDWQQEDAHPWQEYNAHGNTCHYPGCRLIEDEHESAGARGGVVRPTSFGFITTPAPPRRRWWHRLTRRSL